MKVLAWILATIGLLGTAVASGILVKNTWDLRILYEVAMSNKSQASLTNPTMMVMIGAALAFGGGLLLGLGLGMPKRSRGAIRQEAVAEYQRGQAAAAQAGAEAQTTLHPRNGA